jgi:hydroxymethylbilane synthase
MAQFSMANQRSTNQPNVIMKHLRIATRKSPLALWQTQAVGQLLLKLNPHLQIELVGLTTAGDKRTDVELTQLGGKSLFVKELQMAVLENQADIAVHSIKDMSVIETPGLTLAAICPREDPRDVLISRNAEQWENLPLGATVGTSSPRRQCQLLALRPDLKVLALRGNVGTRIEKLDRGDYDAIILAYAGLKRLDMAKRISQFLDLEQFLPAIGQGAIGVECRSNDSQAMALLQNIDDWASRQCVVAERAVNLHLGGDCYTPIGANAIIFGKEISIQALIGSMDGKILLKESAVGPVSSPEEVGRAVAEKLVQRGARKLCPKS